jgi:hypothetical protein
MWPWTGSWDTSPPTERILALLEVAGVVLLVAAVVTYLTFWTPVNSPCGPGVTCARVSTHYWSAAGLTLLILGVCALAVGFLGRVRLSVTGRRGHGKSAASPPS